MLESFRNVLYSLTLYIILASVKMKANRLILLISISSDTCNAQWVQVPNGMGNIVVFSLATRGNNLFAAGGGTYAVYLSTNNGTSWFHTSLYNETVLTLAVNTNTIFAGTGGNGVYKSANDGTNWIQTPLNNRTIYSLAVNGNITFAGCGNSGGIYLSTNNGISWIQGGWQYLTVFSFTASGNNIFAGTPSGVYLSTDSGLSWTQTSLNNRYVRALALNGNAIFAGVADTGIYKSTNNGTTWTQTSLNNQYILSFAANGNTIFAGTNGNGVFVSNDNGTTWTQRNEGLWNLTELSLCTLNNYIFAGTNANSVFRRPLNELIGVTPISEKVPEQYDLYQNFPNPFNPTTKFRLQISKTSNTKVTVYDILGREVEILVNQQLKPGTYEIRWDGSNFPSGVYYYKMISDDFMESKKMVLIK